jgi:CHAT domain-containing protein
LRRLYDVLIAPIVKDLPPGARVTFVPQGSLFLVPFPALLDPQDRPLIARFTPSTAPAIGVLDSLPPLATAHRAATEVLVVGNPALPPAFAHLGSLQGAEREAQEVATHFRTLPLTGTAATKEAVVAAMQRSRLIHLAGHGLLEYGGEKDLPGALIFAPGRDGGVLTARETAGLHLQADLVVLSACDSGGGRITGDGVVGLARSFLTAGAQGVVVSLWEVDDEATAFLMSQFYRHLKQGNDRAGALRQAMLDTRERHQDPRLWAAFTFIGVEPAHSP